MSTQAVESEPAPEDPQAEDQAHRKTPQVRSEASQDGLPEDPRQAPELMVEAALFSSGEPMGLEEICEKTRLPRGVVEDSLQTLVASYDDRRTSLQIVKSGTKWAMALTSRYADAARHIVPPEIPIHLLRTLALVAYHQPMLQSDLKEMVGSKVYEHVGRLQEAGLVRKRPEGLTYELTTTSDFPEYFGIPADEPERIREYLAERVGILSDGGAPQTGQATDVRDAPPIPGVDPDGG